MKKNITNIIVKNSGLVLSFTALMFFTENAHAQFVNKGDVKVSNGTILSIYEDYDNKQSGNFINDGLVHVFANWNNDGTVTYTASRNGKTFFTGTGGQLLEGTKTSDFKNIVFDNSSDAIPFFMGTSFLVDGNVEFKNGIVLADPYGGKLIFNENGDQDTASNLSFVDGEVEKRGAAAFEFPVGSGNNFRPSYHAAGNSNNDIYTTQYFNKNSDTPEHKHSDRVPEILQINTKEYWKVTQNNGSDKVVLSLTLDSRTTPDEFLNPSSGYKVVITRWDEISKKWISEGGEVSEPQVGGRPQSEKTYQKLLMTTVSGYGIFTMALVKEAQPESPDVIVYNALSPNGDGLNDTFLIKGINEYPDNQVEIYNRWGVKVYEAKSYNESDVMFRGYSDGRATVNRGEKLPTGTYFYILKYNKNGKGIEKTGYLYINNQ